MTSSKTFKFLLRVRALAVVGLFFLDSLPASGARIGGSPLWREGLTRQDVVAALGEPEGDVANGSTERMIYKGGLLVTLTSNQVTGIEGAIPDVLKPKPQPLTAPPAIPVAAATTASTVSEPTQPVKSTADASPSATPSPATAVSATTSSNTSASVSPSTSGDQDSEKIISDFSTTSIVPQGTTMSAAIAKALGPGADGSGAAGTGALPKGLASLVGSDNAAAASSPWSTIGTWEWFVAGLVLKTLIMTGVLKGTFAYKEFPVLWREAAFVAFGVSLCNQALAWLFSLNDFGKIAAMVQADQLVAGAVLLGLIMHFTAAKQFPTAAGIMISAMSANIAVGYAQLFFF